MKHIWRHRPTAWIIPKFHYAELHPCYPVTAHLYLRCSLIPLVIVYWSIRFVLLFIARMLFIAWLNDYTLARMCQHSGKNQLIIVACLFYYLIELRINEIADNEIIALPIQIFGYFSDAFQHLLTT